MKVDEIIIGHMDEHYIKYLHKRGDRGVLFTKEEEGYPRPYFPVYEKNGLLFAAPLVSSHKGQKLVNSPLPEDEVFFPLDTVWLDGEEQCMGGVYLGRMVPHLPKFKLFGPINISERTGEVYNETNKKYINLIRLQNECILDHMAELQQKAAEILELAIQKAIRLKHEGQENPHYEKRNSHYPDVLNYGRLMQLARSWKPEGRIRQEAYKRDRYGRHNFNNGGGFGNNNG